MDNISLALNNFKELMNCNYDFIIVCNKQKSDIKLTFESKDFYHLVGFQYLKDIDIPKNEKQLFKKIESLKITDEYLGKSVFYTKVDYSYANVKERISGFKDVDKFIENKNIICRYIKTNNPSSAIKADYLIKSTLYNRTAYMFLRKRSKGDEYCMCSFFMQPQNEYIGQKTYRLYKAKKRISDNYVKILLDRISESTEQ